MANFGTLVITTAGMALQGKVEAGRTTLTFTRVAIGDGTLPSGTSLSSLTNLINPKMSVTINSITVNNSLATLKFTFSNSGLTNGFNLRELGIFANDPDAGEILYAVANAGNSPDYLPAEGSNIVEEIFEVVAAIGSTSNVTATIDKSLTFLPLVGGNMAGAINEAEAPMAAAATMNIGTTAGNFIFVTGTTTITAFDNVQAGARRTLKFTNPLTITYNAASMILPGATSLAVCAGDVAEFISLGNGNWACINYQPAVGNLPSNGTAVNASKLNNTSSGNASGNTPVSNGTVCTNLNTDMLDGKHADDSANNIPVYDANKNISGNAATATNVTTNINGHSIFNILEPDGVTAKKATIASTATFANVAKSLGGYAGSLNNMLGVWPQILAPLLRKVSLSLNAHQPGAITFDGTYLYVVTTTNPTVVTKVNPALRVEVGSLTLNSGEDSGMAITFDGTYLYVVNSTIPTIITKVNPTTMARVGSLTLNSGENYGIAITFDGTYLYVVNWINPTIITKVNPTTMARVGSLTLNSGEGSGHGITFDGNYLYVVNSSDPTIVTKVNPTTMARVGSLTLNSGEYYGYQITFDGTYLYVVSSSIATTITKVNPTTMTRIGSLTLNSLESYGITFDGTYLYLVHYESPTIVTKVNPTTMAKVGSLTLNSGENYGMAITFDGTYLYIVNNTYPLIIKQIDVYGNYWS